MSPEFPARLWQVSLSAISIAQIHRFPDYYAGPTYCHSLILQTRGQRQAAAALDAFLNASWLQDTDLDFLPELLTLNKDGDFVDLREDGGAVRQGERLHLYHFGETCLADVDYAAFCEIVRLNLEYLRLRRFWIDEPLKQRKPVRGLPYYQAERGFRVRVV